MAETLIGTCKHCGQKRTLEVAEGTSELYVDEQVSKNCQCLGAARERLKIETIGNVNSVFGYECGEGFKPVEEDELSYILETVNALVDEVISKVSFSLRSGGVCKMKFKDITCIEVTREEKKVARRSS